MISRRGKRLISLTTLVVTLLTLFIFPHSTRAAETAEAGFNFQSITYKNVRYNFVFFADGIKNDTEPDPLYDGKQKGGVDEYPFAIFKSTKWVNDNPEKVNSVKETSTQRFFKVKKDDYYLVKLGKLKKVTASLHVYYKEGIFWKTSDADTKISDVEVSIPGDSIPLFEWKYTVGQELRFETEPPIVSSSKYGDFKRESSSNPTKYTNGNGYSLALLQPPNKLPLPTTANFFGPNDKSFGEVSILEKTADPVYNDTVSIAGGFFLGPNRDSKYRLNDADIPASEKFTVTIKGLTAGKEPRGEKSTEVSLKTGASYTFTYIPKDGKYEVSTRIKMSTAWEDIGSRFANPLDINAKIVGGDDFYLAGKTIVTVDKDGKQSSGDISLEEETVTTEEKTMDLVEDTILPLLRNIINSLSDVVASVMGLVSTTIKASADIENTPGVKDTWKSVRNLSVSLLTLGLLLIAFANILSVDIEKYGLNRMIPKIVIGIVMTIFSFEIARFLLELATAFSYGLGEVAGGESQLSGSMNTITNLIKNLVLPNLAQGIFILLLVIGLLLVCIWLAIILYVRYVVILFLVAIAPLAFMMQIMPFTEKLYKMWWDKFWQWVFMGPVIMFFLYLGSRFLSDGYISQTLNQDPSLVNLTLNPAGWAFLILAAVCWGIAAYVPLIMGKEIYKKIGGIGKNKLFNKIPQVRKAKELLGAREKQAQQRAVRSANTTRQGWALSDSRFKRGFLANVRPDEVKQFEEGYVSEKQKEFASLPKTNLESDFISVATGEKKVSALDERAITRAAAENGALGLKDDTPENKERNDKILDHLRKSSLLEDDKDIAKILVKEEPGVVARMAERDIELGEPRGASVGLANKTLSKKAEDYKPEQVVYMANHDPVRFDGIIATKASLESILKSNNTKLIETTAAQISKRLASQTTEEKRRSGEAQKWLKSTIKDDAHKAVIHEFLHRAQVGSPNQSQAQNQGAAENSSQGNQP